MENSLKRMSEEMTGSKKGEKESNKRRKVCVIRSWPDGVFPCGRVPTENSLLPAHDNPLNYAFDDDDDEDVSSLPDSPLKFAYGDEWTYSYDEYDDLENWHTDSPPSTPARFLNSLSLESKLMENRLKRMLEEMAGSKNEEEKSNKRRKVCVIRSWPDGVFPCGRVPTENSLLPAPSSSIDDYSPESRSICGFCSPPLTPIRTPSLCGIKFPSSTSTSSSPSTESVPSSPHHDNPLIYAFDDDDDEDVSSLPDSPLKFAYGDEWTYSYDEYDDLENWHTGSPPSTPARLLDP